ncbi:MAG TPA: prephenate dehydrogenase [Saprospiraceae bacterium]|jgi:prephenate dehydrogenase|nr:prephenate dehydrogenase [Saprospiraceae bacterium]HRG22113.1 prephenate dehydrogenase [Saprospiraceae bacterium]
MKVVIAGLGLIGGSVALALKRQINVELKGIDKNAAHGNKALKLGLVPEVTNWASGLEWADVIILAIPVNAIEDQLSDLLDRVRADQTIIDLGSTKAEMVNSIKGHKNRGRWVAAHPLAGTEYSGPEAAVYGLFEGKKNIVCHPEQSDADALKTAYVIFEALGLHTLEMDAAEHDKHLAYVSHLSHVSSFMLGLAVLQKEKDAANILNLAGTGFASTVRLAKSLPATWLPIFMANRCHVLEALETYQQCLDSFKLALQNNNAEALMQLMNDANAIKKIL